MKIRKFNDSVTSNSKVERPDIDGEVFKVIRNIFIEFEDNGIISYAYERYAGSPIFNFDPNSGREDDGRFINNLTSIINRSSTTELNISCDIRMPKTDGLDISLLEDILVSIKRIELEGFSVKLYIYGNHHLYKPCKVLVTIPVR